MHTVTIETGYHTHFSLSCILHGFWNVKAWDTSFVSFQATQEVEKIAHSVHSYINVAYYTENQLLTIHITLQTELWIGPGNMATM